MRSFLFKIVVECLQQNSNTLFKIIIIDEYKGKVLRIWAIWLFTLLIYHLSHAVPLFIYNKERGLRGDPTMVSALLTAIEQFVKETIKGEIKKIEISPSERVIFLKREKELCGAIITDSNLSRFAEKLLENALHLFMELYGEHENDMEVGNQLKFKGFKEVLELLLFKLMREFNRVCGIRAHVILDKNEVLVNDLLHIVIEIERFPGYKVLWVKNLFPADLFKVTSTNYGKIIGNSLFINWYLAEPLQITLTLQAVESGKREVTPYLIIEHENSKKLFFTGNIIFKVKEI